MKIYIDLLDDEFREIFPATMFKLKRKIEDLLLPKMVDYPHHAGLISSSIVQLAINEAMNLSRTVAEFSYSDEDNEDGFVQGKMGRFTVELKVDEAIDNVDKAYDTNNNIDHIIRMGGEEAKALSESWEAFKREDFKPQFMYEVRTTFRELETQIWEHICSRLKEILIVVEPTQNVAIGKF